MIFDTPNYLLFTQWAFTMGIGALVFLFAWLFSLEVVMGIWGLINGVISWGVRRWL